jgi:hypothetical protein
MIFFQDFKKRLQHGHPSSLHIPYDFISIGIQNISQLLKLKMPLW